MGQQESSVQLQVTKLGVCFSLTCNEIWIVLFSVPTYFLSFCVPCCLKIISTQQNIICMPASASTFQTEGKGEKEKDGCHLGQRLPLAFLVYVTEQSHSLLFHLTGQSWIKWCLFAKDIDTCSFGVVCVRCIFPTPHKTRKLSLLKNDEW